MHARVQLVVPCYNEAGRLNSDAFLELVATNCDIDLIFVDDGSRDATAAILADLAKRGNGSISVLALNQNVGKARAVQLGLLAALEHNPEFIGFWDADLSTPLTALSEFIEVLKTKPDVDIVMGARVKLLGRHITRSPIRHYCGRVFATAASVALGISVYDTQCGAKLFRATEPVRQVFSVPFRSKWIFDVEILSRYIAATGAAQSESRICEVPLKSWTDVPGSKLSVWNAVRAVWDLVWISRQSASGR